MHNIKHVAVCTNKHIVHTALLTSIPQGPLTTVCNGGNERLTNPSVSSRRAIKYSFIGCWTLGRSVITAFLSVRHVFHACSNCVAAFSCSRKQIVCTRFKPFQWAFSSKFHIFVSENSCLSGKLSFYENFTASNGQKTKNANNWRYWLNNSRRSSSLFFFLIRQLDYFIYRPVFGKFHPLVSWPSGRFVFMIPIEKYTGEIGVDFILDVFK